MDDVKKILVQKFQNDILANPDVKGNYISLGNLFLTEELYEDALSVYLNFIEKFPPDFEVLSNLGGIYFFKADYVKAIDYFQKAIEIEKNVFSLYFNIANCYAELRYFDQALKNYNKALKLSPDNDVIYASIGLLYKDMQQYEEACDYYQRAIDCSENSIDYALQKASICTILRRFDDVVSDMQKYLQSEPNNYLLYLYLGGAYFAKNLVDEAEACFNKIYEINPGFYQAYLCHAIYLSENGQVAKAVVQLQKAIELQPEETGARLILANILTSENNYIDAIEIYKDILSKTNLSNVHVLLGNTYILNSDTKKALEAYRAAVNADRSDIDIKMIYAEVVHEFLNEKYNIGE